MEEDIRRAKQYSKLKIWSAIVQFVLTVAFLAIMLVSGASVLLRDVVAGWTQSFYSPHRQHTNLLRSDYWEGVAGLKVYYTGHTIQRFSSFPMSLANSS